VRLQLSRGWRVRGGDVGLWVRLFEQSIDRRLHDEFL
jgi:hypothetical protein